MKKVGLVMIVVSSLCRAMDPSLQMELMDWERRTRMREHMYPAVAQAQTERGVGVAYTYFTQLNMLEAAPEFSFLTLHNYVKYNRDTDPTTCNTIKNVYEAIIAKAFELKGKGLVSEVSYVSPELLHAYELMYKNNIQMKEKLKAAIEKVKERSTVIRIDDID